MGKGIVGVAGIAACAYLGAHGFEGWPVFWMAVFTLLLCVEA